MESDDAVNRVRDFFCDHRALEIVKWNPTTGTMIYRCRNPMCGKQTESLQAFNGKGYT